MILLNTESPPVAGATRDVLVEPVSASRLNLFHGCRLRFYFRYVLGIQKPASLALHVGKSVHASLQNWSQRRWLGKPACAEDLKDEFLSAWKEQLEAEPVKFEEPDEQEKEQQKAWGLVEMYLRETPIPVEEKPEAVEVLVERDLHEHGLPVLRGVIDLVRQGGRIVDFKTTSTAPNESLVLHRNELQLTCYSLLYREATGTREKGFELHHLVKTKTPKLVVTEHPASSEMQVNRLFRAIESYIEGVTREDWVPSPGLQCTTCEFFNECRGGAAL